MPYKKPLTIIVALLFIGFSLISSSSAQWSPPAAVPSHSPFVVVFIDQQTESRIGTFPYDRSVLAAAVRRSAELGARGVVLKFFLDVPRSVSGDSELAAAMKSIPVLLQSGDGTYSPAVLPERFMLPFAPGLPAATASSGGLPLVAFLSSARDIGFVDNIGTDRLPGIEKLSVGYVKSLYVECLELALGKRAKITPGVSIRFGNRGLPLDSHNELFWKPPPRDDLKYIPFADYLDRTMRTDVRDKVVIIGYDSSQSPVVQTPIGSLKVHRLFYYGLISLYSSLATTAAGP